MSFSTLQKFQFWLAGRSAYLWAIIYYHELVGTEAEKFAFEKMIQCGLGTKSQCKKVVEQTYHGLVPPKSLLRKYAFFRIFEIDFLFSFWKFRYGYYSPQCDDATEAISILFDYAVSTPGSDEANISLERLDKIKIISSTEQNLMIGKYRGYSNF